MAQPLIGITPWPKKLPNQSPYTGVAEEYVRALQEAGAAAVIIPLIPIKFLDRILTTLDGVLLSGGGDIQPERYGGQNSPQVQGIDPLRDEVEFHITQYALANEVPLLGICRGLQVINVFLGGTLYEHLPDHLRSSLNHSTQSHLVRIVSQSSLHQILGCEQIAVNSSHHQGIAQLGKRLKPVAYAQDDLELIEAVEVEGHPYGLAVQWHPERMRDDPHMRSLFASFVAAASHYSSQKAHP